MKRNPGHDEQHDQKMNDYDGAGEHLALDSEANILLADGDGP